MPQGETIRVAIVEDDPQQLALVRHTLAANADLEVVGAWTSGRTALASLMEANSLGRRADVVLIDLGLPDLSGAEVARRLVQLADPPEIVVLTAHGERSMALEALHAGACGYLLKGNTAELPAAVRIAAAGGSIIAPAIARFLLEEVRIAARPGEAGIPLGEFERGGLGGDGNADIRAQLTKREREVLALLAKGLTYDEAAKLLGISLGTIQSHVKSLYRKLDVTSKAEAAAEAVRRGLAWS
ncbi:response regulator [Vulgatibacter incomptus]|uniref:Putative two-component system response regulator n=1 Tax=Vulgatibacter incomptus TaxID=1391653 RepID=A0A0K1PF32_9BACT|nr:response regulator transcription factor [Vulgatibacter incomptus]AKU92143.1 putative two-component system response regulator [Vulgatibacter incomptus]